MSDRLHPRTSRKGTGSASPAHPVSSARAVALRVLGDLREGRRTARQSIDALLAEYPLEPQDLALAHELVMGVVRHRLTLARIVGAFATHGWKRINHRLQSILLLAVYQIVWLDHIPAFAAVNEAVEQAKAEGGGGAARFVNGLLRQLLREIVERRVPRADASPPHAVPVNRQQSCQFARAILPDPAQKPAEHLADATSHPVWLVQRWMEAFGKAATEQICLTGMSEPPLIVRPNTLRTTAAGLVGTLRKEGFRAERSSDDHAVHVEGERSPIRSEAFARGLFQPQDRTSMEPVLRGMPGLAPGQTVIDYCAGLGTKATQMAELMRDTGRVLACEVEEPKLATIRTNAERLGIRIVETCLTSEAPARVASLGEVDWILVDVPCSNTGVLARRPEARYRLNVPALLSLAKLQLSILESAAALAGPTTRLVYSTCSIDLEENAQVVTRFLQAHPEWRLADSGFTLPDSGRAPIEWRDGGYWARLERKGSA